ncbi:MAG: gamma-glutamyltransferase, partial [Phycisphaerales bacterium]|nr:gamma-glutamyltransferase [Phycisphaerales bacterium]
MTSRGGRCRLARVCLFLHALMIAACAGTPPANPHEAWHAFYSRQAVAADHDIASRAGARMLELGGNAVDAAVAASFTLSVVRPYSCGIGGGGFMVIYLPHDPRRGAVSVALDYRETGPGAIRERSFVDAPDGASRVGGLAAGVPGTTFGLLHALETWGTLDRATVLAPAIEAARAGFHADAHYASEARDLIADFEQHPEWKVRFEPLWRRYLLNGTVREGSFIHVPEQARALEAIAALGADAWRAGELGRAAVEAARAQQGVITQADLAGYAVRELAPLRGTVLGHTVLTMPPPSSGGIALLEIFGLAERTTPRRAESGDPAREGEDIDALHAWIEASRHAFADRARYLGDPAFVPDPSAWLLAPARLDEIAARFDPHRAHASAASGTPEEDGGTSHLSVVDRWGGAVACTETINLAFGSLVMIEDWGVVLNNEMDDFTARPGEPNAFGLVQSARNAPAPGKRPLSSMTPTIVLDATGEVRAVLGGSGGPRIISATAQVLNRVLAGQDAATAVRAPRAHHQWQPDVVRLESWGRAEWGGTGEALRQRGHTVEDIGVVAQVQLIARETTPEGAAQWHAASDPRKGGRPAG